MVELARGGSDTSRAFLSSCTMLSSLLSGTRGLLKKASRFLSVGILAGPVHGRSATQIYKFTVVSWLSGGIAAQPSTYRSATVQAYAPIGYKGVKWLHFIPPLGQTGIF